jgi:uncharacterized protein YqgC (DUF456 family)
VLTLLSIAAMVLAHLASALGVRSAGGSRWAMVGALVGAILGLAVPPAGLLLGPLLGAIAVELWRTHQLAESIRVGVGAVIGVLAGIVAHVALAFTMVALFAWWVWAGMRSRRAEKIRRPHDTRSFAPAPPVAALSAQRPEAP